MNGRLGFLVSFIVPHKRAFLLLVSANIGVTIFTLAIPLAIKHAIDRGLVADNSEQLYLYLGIAVGASFGVWAFSIAATYFRVFAYRVLADMRVALYAKVQRLGIDFFERERTGRVISRLTNDVDALENIVADGAYQLFSNLLLLLGIEIMMFSIDWHLALAVNVVFPFMLLATVVYRTLSVRAYRLTRERLALVTAYIQEAVAGMRVVQSFSMQRRLLQRFHEVNEDYRRVNMQTIWQAAVYFPGVELLGIIGTGIALWYGGYLTVQDALTIGTVFAFVAYLNDFFSPIQQLSQFFSSFLSAMAALDRVADVFDEEPTIVDAPDARELSNVRGAIELSGVTFAYPGTTRTVLHDVSISVPAGATVALVGQTGAGKSTLARLIARLYDPDAGTITLDGTDVRSLKVQWLRRSLGIVPQEGFLFSGTIADNIRYARPGASDEDVEAAARAVGAHDLISALHDGYQTEVGERGARLSSGERQLVAFARALLADPPILLLDEPTSSIDVASEQRLTTALATVAAGRTTIVIAHRLSTIREADLIVVVDGGRVVEHGSHAQLLALNGTYATLHAGWLAAADDRDRIEQLQALSSQTAMARPTSN